MNWFKQHLNWTFFLAWLIANVLVYSSFLIPASATGEPDPSSSLLIFLDKNYSTLWDEANLPDFDKIQWSDLASESPYRWQTGALVVYLENVGKRTIEVNASATEKPGYAIPGISISSDTIILMPNERKPMTITIDRSPEVLAWSSASAGTRIYFNTSVTQSEGLNSTQITFFILAALLVLGTEVWYLLQKRRSLFFLFLNLLSWVGFIILLSLENRATPEGSRNPADNPIFTRF